MFHIQIFSFKTEPPHPTVLAQPLGFLPQESAAEPTERQRLPKPEEDDPPKTSVGIRVGKNEKKTTIRVRDVKQKKRSSKYMTKYKILQIDRESAGVIHLLFLGTCGHLGAYRFMESW